VGRKRLNFHSFFLLWIIYIWVMFFRMRFCSYSHRQSTWRPPFWIAVWIALWEISKHVTSAILNCSVNYIVGDLTRLLPCLLACLHMRHHSGHIRLNRRSDHKKLTSFWLWWVYLFFRKFGQKRLSGLIFKKNKWLIFYKIALNLKKCFSIKCFKCFLSWKWYIIA